MKESTKQTQEEMSSFLLDVTAQLKLLAFAAEARRTLDSIKDLASLHPEFAGTIGGGVLHWQGWTDYEDVSGEVLRTLAFKADRMIERIEDGEVGNV